MNTHKIFPRFQHKSEIPEELETWRKNIIGKTYVVTAFLTAPLILYWVYIHLLKKSSPHSPSSTFIYLTIYFIIVILAISKKTASYIKAWGLILLLYLTGTLALFQGGLAGDGRTYYMILPILAALLINMNTGMATLGLVTISYAVVSIMAHFGYLTQGLFIMDNPLRISAWLQEGLVILIGLALVLDLQNRHNKLLISLAAEKSTLLHNAKESENRYQLVLELVSDLAYVLAVNPDDDITIEWLTNALSQFLPASFENISHLIKIVHPDDLEIVQKRMQSLQNGEAGEDEIRIIDQKNIVRWVHSYARPVWDESHTRVVRILGVIQDITSEKLAKSELQRRNEEMSRLYRASETLFFSKTPSPEILAETIIKTVLKEFGQSNCSLFLVEQTIPSKLPVLTRVAIAGCYIKEIEPKTLGITGLGLVPKAIRSGKIINVPEVSESPDYVRSWKKARSELVIPLKVGESVIGAIDMQSTEPDAFSEDDERLVSIFAERAAAALENARLNTETQQRLEQIGALRHIDNAITGAFDLRPILRILLEETITQLSVDAASILLFDRHMQTLRYADRRGFQSPALQHSHLQLGEGYAGKAALERRIIHIDNIFEDENELSNSPLLLSENFRTYFGVPLIAKGEIKGVLEIFHRTTIDPDPHWLSFLETLAAQAAIAIDNATMFEDLQRSNAELLQAYDATLEGWVSALDLRDHETKNHTQRVTEITLNLAQAMGLHGEKLLQIKRGALLHDIGKMGIPDRILLKPGKLTNEEWEVIQKHPIYAKQFLSQIEYLLPASDIPYCHHEKWDGSGYPQGLKGKQIPLAARIFAIVDVWDALNSDRPYRKAKPRNEVIAYIKKESGIHFDPEIVEVFIKLIGEKG